MSLTLMRTLSFAAVSSREWQNCRAETWRDSSDTATLTKGNTASIQPQKIQRCAQNTELKNKTKKNYSCGESSVQTWCRQIFLFRQRRSTCATASMLPLLLSLSLTRLSHWSRMQCKTVASSALFLSRSSYSIFPPLPGVALSSLLKQDALWYIWQKIRRICCRSCRGLASMRREGGSVNSAGGW